MLRSSWVEALEGRVLLHGTGEAHGPAAPVERLAGPAGTITAATALLPDLVPLVNRQRNYLHGWILDRSQVQGHTLLRFTTAVGNAGRGPIELRGGPTNGATQDVFQRVYHSDGSTADRLAGAFTYHAEHGHVHVDEFAQYALRSAGPKGEVGTVVASSDKVSFCLLDRTAHDRGLPGAPQAPHYITCDNGVQGISVGWSDVYERNLPGQWIDVTDVPAGEYWLEVVIDPQGRLTESDETNNTARIRVTLEATGGAIPTPDRLEPNNVAAAAADLGVLGAGREEGLSIDASADVDYFRLTAASGGTLAVEVTGAAANVTLVLLDAGQAELARSAGETEGRRVSAAASAGAVYYVRVESAGGAVGNYSLSVQGPPPTVRVTAGDALATEGTTDSASFTFTRNGPTDVPLTVLYAVGGSASNGTDYETLFGSVVIPVLQASFTVELRPADDAAAEGDEQASITLVADDGYAIEDAAGTASVTIVDDDTLLPLPAPWASADVGPVGLAGGADASGGQRLIVRGSGPNAAGAGDGFHFVYQPLPADGAVIARLDGWDGSDASTRAGVALRRGRGASGAGAALLVGGDGNLVLQVRRADGRRARLRALGPVTGPAWLRLTRSGRSVTAATSADGAAWHTRASASLAAWPDALAGLVSTSADAARVSTAAFSDAAVIAAPASPVGFTAVNAGNGVTLSWDDRATNETAYLVERAARGRRKFSLLATLPPDAVSFDDVADPAVGRRYVYRVRAVNAGGSSAATVSITLPRPTP